MPTKQNLARQNKALRGGSPPDSNELRKNLAQSGIRPEDAGLSSTLDKSVKKPGTEDSVFQAEKMEEGQGGVPNPQQNFQIVMMKYGFREGQAKQISEHAAEIGGPRIFSDPVALLEILNKFPYIGNPPQRKNILDHWIAVNGLAFTPEYQQLSGQDPTKGTTEFLKKAEAKFAVDPSTGNIRQAMEGEKGLTLGEAEVLQAKHRMDHPLPPGNNGQQQPKEPQIIVDEHGNPTINPKANNLTVTDLLALNSLQPRPSDIDTIIQNEDRKKVLQEVFNPGGNRGGSSTLDESVKIFGLLMEPVKMQMVQMNDNFSRALAATNESISKAITAMTEAIKDGGKPKEDPKLAQLEIDLKNERELRHQEELARRDAEAKRQEDINKAKDAEIAKMNARIESLASNPPGAKNELDVITSIGSDVKGEIHEIGKTVSGILTAKFAGGRPEPLPPEQKKIIISGINESLRSKPATPSTTPPSVPKTPTTTPPDPNKARLAQLYNETFGGKK